MEPIYLDSAAFREFAGEQARFFAKTIPLLLGGAAQ